MKILIVGSGDIGTAVAHALQDKGDDVIALRRNPPREHNMIQYIQVDITDKESLEALDNDFKYLLFIVAPESRDEQTYKKVYEVGLTNMLQLFPKAIFLFVSSTAVYGQSQGEWVDEESETKPTNFRADVLLKAENAVQEHNKKNCIIRFSGIYGRGENHILKKLKEKQDIQFEPPYFTNRIHREDCVGVIVYLLDLHYHDRLPHQVYIATDKLPLPLYEWASLKAKEHSLPLPKKAYHDKQSPQNKQLSSQRLQELGYQFKYPYFH